MAFIKEELLVTLADLKIKEKNNNTNHNINDEIMVVI